MTFIKVAVGVFLIMGAVGGLEMDTMSIPQSLVWCIIGFGLVGWAMPEICSDEESTRND